MSNNGLATSKYWGIYGYDEATAGTSNNPIAINDLADLQAISSTNWGAGVYYQQTDDITLTANVNYYGFIGNYNGGGFCINGDNTYYIVISMPNKGDKTKSVIEKVKFKNIHRFDAIVIGGTVKNCMFDTISLSSSNSQQVSLIKCDRYQSSLDRRGTVINCIAIDCTLVGGTQYATRYSAVFIGYASDNYALDSSVSNSVSISCSVTGSQYNYKIGASNGVSLSNNYATNGGSSTTDSNGLSITSTQYNSQSWWENTAGYDMSSANAVWEWDTATQLPKLKHISLGKIALISISSPSPSAPSATITATATLERTPATDSGNVTFYVTQTPETPASWTSVGSQQISSQSAGVITHTWSASSTAGEYYVKAILYDITKGVTYDCFIDGGGMLRGYCLSTATGGNKVWVYDGTEWVNGEHTFTFNGTEWVESN